jgi:peptide/nickel transport system permease protein
MSDWSQSSRPPQSRRYALTWRIIWRNKLTVVGLGILLIVALIALFPSFFAPYDPIQIDLVNRLAPPSREHLFGTDDFGRDIFSRIIYGARLSFFTALGVVFVSAVIGCLLGIFAGYMGGWVDEVLMRFTDIVLAFPAVLLAMVIVTALSPSLANAALTLVIIGWPEYARVMRSQTLIISRHDYVTAARSVGASGRILIFRHIFPNTMPPLIVQASLNLGVIILSLAALGFLGLGAQAPAPEWGLMISDGRNYFLDAWWFPVFPGFAIALTTLAFNFLGDGLRDIFDPRSYKYG